MKMSVIHILKLDVMKFFFPYQLGPRMGLVIFFVFGGKIKFQPKFTSETTFCFRQQNLPQLQSFFCCFVTPATVFCRKFLRPRADYGTSKNYLSQPLFFLVIKLKKRKKKQYGPGSSFWFPKLSNKNRVVCQSHFLRGTGVNDFILGRIMNKLGYLFCFKKLLILPNSNEGDVVFSAIIWTGCFYQNYYFFFSFFLEKTKFQKCV